MRKQLVVFLMLMVSAVFAGTMISSGDNKNEVITNITDLRAYTEATIKGEVVKILDEDEYRIKDESGKIKVYTGWQNNVGLKVGDNVTVKGYLDPGFFREFYASEITLQNGEKIILKRDE
jgi:uncharacterized protein YdeI (BOF family)